MKRFFMMAVGLVGIGGSVKNAFGLFPSFYVWNLVRFAGYGSLFVYALLMLRWARYNTDSLSKEE